MKKWNRWGKIMVALLLCLVVAASLGTSFGVVAGAQEASNAGKEAATADTAPSGPSPWTPDTCLLNDATQQIYPSMATDSHGYLWMACMDYNLNSASWGIRLMESTNNGATWATVSTDYLSGYNLFYPDIAIDPSNNKVYIVYERVFSTSDHDIWYGTYTPGVGAVWNQLIDNDLDYDANPSITCEYQYGGAHYVYGSYEYVHNNDDRDLMFARSTDDGANWTVKKLHGDGTDSNVHMETDITNAQGRIYIAYRHSSDAIPQAGESEIWCDISSDFGNNFSQVKVMDNSPRPVRNPSVAATHGGNAVVIGYEYDYSATDRDVYYAYSTNGGSTWSAFNVLSNSTANEHEPYLTADGWGSSSDAIYGKINAIYWKSGYIYYRSAAYNAPAVWTAPQQVNDTGQSGTEIIAITSQMRVDGPQPCVAWHDAREADWDIYCSTIALSPTVTTNAATGVGTTVATLNGNLTRLGTAASVQVSFQWGLTTAYGNTTTAQTRTATGAFSAALSGLTCGTTYHFLAKAVGHGTWWGSDMTFTTGTCPTTPPTVSTNAATGVTTSCVTLNGNLTSLGTATNVSVSFEWGLTTAYGNGTTVQTRSTTGAFSVSGCGLTPCTTYHFRAKAVGNGTAYGNDMTFTTQCITAPTAKVIPATQNVAKGATFSVDIVVDPFTYGVSGGEVNIAFDPSILSANDIVWGDLFGANPLVGTKQINNTAGTIKYALARQGTTTPPTPAGKFATITFTVKTTAAAGTYAIDITTIGLADQNAVAIPGIVITDGSVTVVGYPRWDINQDGTVDYRDLAILGAHYGQTTSPPYPAWDINQDGIVDYRDLAILGAHYG